jgi:hypothetical protein
MDKKKQLWTRQFACLRLVCDWGGYQGGEHFLLRDFTDCNYNITGEMNCADMLNTWYVGSLVLCNGYAFNKRNYYDYRGIFERYGDIVSDSDILLVVDYKIKLHLQ